MIEWMAQAAPLREASTVKKMNDRSLLFCLNKITYYFKKWATGNSPERHVYASRLSKAKGFCTEPQKGVFSLYFDSFSPPNAKRSKIKTFLKVSLVSLTFRLRTVFYFFGKNNHYAGSPWKNEISVSAFVHLTTFQTKIIATCSVE